MYVKKGKTLTCNLVYKLLVEISMNQIEGIVSDRIFEKVKNEQVRITENIMHPVFYSIVREVAIPFAAIPSASSTDLLNH